MIKVYEKDYLEVEFKLPFTEKFTENADIDISDATIKIGNNNSYKLGEDGFYLSYNNGWILKLKKNECDKIPEGKYLIEVSAYDSFGKTIINETEELFVYGESNEEVGLELDPVTPLDLLNSKNYTSKEQRDRRYEICKSCPELFKPTRTCKKCGCFMSMKTWLKDASCPINKW